MSDFKDEKNSGNVMSTSDSSNNSFFSNLVTQILEEKNVQTNNQTTPETNKQLFLINEVLTGTSEGFALNIKNNLVQEIQESNTTFEPNDFLQPQTNNAEVVLKKETESLKSLMSYNISSEDESSNDEHLIESGNYRSPISISSCSDRESSDSDSADSITLDSSSSSQDTEDDSFDTSVPSKEHKGAVKKTTAYKTTGEIDLPPLPDLCQLKIDYEKEKFIHIGNVQAIIDTIVTIEALPNMPAYDLETVLFMNHHGVKRPVGTIFDVIGPVANPIYCIRFNSRKEIDEQEITFGTEIYSAPKSEFTQYVFLKELMKIKGTDASWLGDAEMPSDLGETSSEDEDIAQEKIPQCTKRKRGSFERHRNFERNMNRCNSLNTRLYKMVDAQKDSFDINKESVHIPLFNPAIPPPGFVNSPRFNIPVNTNPSVPAPNFVRPIGRQNPRHPLRYPPSPLFANQTPFSNNFNNRSHYSDRSNNRSHYQW